MTKGLLAPKISTLKRIIEEVDNWKTGEAAREERKSAKVSLRAVAAEMKLSAPYVSDLELGRRNWTQDLRNRFFMAVMRCETNQKIQQINRATKEAHTSDLLIK